MKNHDWIGVDLDRTLARRISGDPITQIGEPILPMVERVRGWIAEGKQVRILTARVNHVLHPEDWQEQLMLIQAWCVKIFDTTLIVTCMKDSGMVELWDDLAVRVEENTKQQMSPAKHGDDSEFHMNWWKSLSDDDRLMLRNQCCPGCGTLNPCQCWNDE